MKVLGIIPARYHSTRLEGKPLAEIEGKTMIQHVYERASQALDEVLVATDDQRIFDEVESFGGKVVMTSSAHNTGTNRCLEAYRQSGLTADVIVNVQGDEPLLEPAQLNEIVSCFEDDSVELATLAFPSEEEGGVYVILDKNGDALYFSRSEIPFHREERTTQILKHVGMYAYTPKAIEEFAKMEQTALELAEHLEQLRWLENGKKIRVAITKYKTVAVDTPEDLERVRQLFQSN